MKYQDIQNEVWRQAAAQEKALGRDGNHWPDLLYAGREEWALIRANAHQADLQITGPDSRKYMGFEVIPVDKQNHLRVGSSEPMVGLRRLLLPATLVPPLTVNHFNGESHETDNATFCTSAVGEPFRFRPDL